ncbi:MAG: 4Fe-4S binding protein [Treponema sp.]|jgi:2-oxoglutarate ferredoxin oxidoreductase subunit delta|nr:4Fe-4S binding protein [Treponema sp.]
MARRGKISIDRENCKGCYLCIRACPLKVIDRDREANSLGVYPARAAFMEKCIACGGCYEVCPDVCIEVYELEGAETA